MMRFLAAIFAVLLAASTVGAARKLAPQPTGFAPYCGDSLECAFGRSDVVCRVTIGSVSESTLEAKVTESFKGQVPVGTMITLPRDYGFKKDQDVILTLRDDAKGKQIPASYSLWSPIMLNGERPYYEMDVRPLVEPAEILAAVRRIAANPPDHYVEPVALFSGGRILHVPATPRLQELAQSWAAEKTVYKRTLALQALRPFKSDQNIAIAQALLSDTRSEQVRMGKWQEGTYDVRARAKEVLNEWGIAVPKLAGSGPIFAYHQVPRLAVSWVIGVVISILILAAISLRWRMARRVFFNLILIALIACTAMLWLRSRTRIDEIMFAAGPSHHEFTSYSGGLQYEVMRDWNHPGGWIYGSFERGFNEDVWSVESQNPKLQKDFIGFVQASGLAEGPGGSTHRFGVLRIPYWALMVPPSALLLLGALRLRRQIRRARLGLCGHCGYDLRASSGGICPECGQAIARPALAGGSEPCLAFSSSTTPAV
jgi:hypothetical protein